MIMTFEVLREELDIFVNCRRQFRSECDIINVGGNNDADLSIGIDVDRGVRFDSLEAIGNSVSTECTFLFHCYAD